MTSTNALVSIATTNLQTGFQTFASDGAFVAAKGSAAAGGDAYYNTTASEFRVFVNSGWHAVVGRTDAQALTNKTISTADNTIQSGAAAAGDVFTANGSGGTSWVTPMAAVYATYTTTTAQAFADNTAVIVNYLTAVEDSHTAVTTGAAWKFTAPTAGRYLVQARIFFPTGGGWATSESAQLYLFKNGASVRVIGEQPAQAATTAQFSLGGGTVVPLAATDYIDIRALQNSGGSLNSSTGAGLNWVSIYRLGA